MMQLERSEDTREIRVFPDMEGVSETALGLIAEALISACRERGRAALVLSGGGAPQGLFRKLAHKGELPWNRIHLFWADERMVPASSSESNFGTARELLISKVAIPGENIHRIRTELGKPEQVAQHYEKELRSFFGDDPMLDVAVMGMGGDGHTASIFPSQVIPSGRWVAATPEPKNGHLRVTLLPSLLNRARLVLFLVNGKEKAQAAQSVLAGKPDMDRLPALRIQPVSGKVLWLLDSGAASNLPDEVIRAAA